MNKLLPALVIPALTLLLGACTQPTTPPVATFTALHARVQGQEALTGDGAAHVQLLPSNSVTGTAPLATAQVGSDGTFTLKLATAAKVNPYLQAMPTPPADRTCSGTVRATPSTARQTLIDSLNLTNTGGVQALMSTTPMIRKQNSDGSVSATYTTNVLFYTDVPTRLAGSQTCTEAEYTLVSEADLNLQAGWNLVSIVSTGIGYLDGRVALMDKFIQGTTAATVWTAAGTDGPATAQSVSAVNVLKELRSHSTFFHRN
ncbi:hypothetical protein [Deinococcus sonorensis]|uniref:Lipoprotein n=2 Tax=Deinococcus sonorensis TaxID=309891 RepID=A0AAU7U816_9DEIO